jgi:hypothetical protein
MATTRRRDEPLINQKAKGKYQKAKGWKMIYQFQISNPKFHIKKIKCRPFALFPLPFAF